MFYTGSMNCVPRQKPRVSTSSRARKTSTIWSASVASRPATAEGAGKWRPHFAAEFPKRDVVIVPDRDEAGRKHALAIAASLVPVARSVRIVELPGLPPKGDVSDWLADTQDLRVDRGMPGDGVIDLPAIRRMVEATGYRGHIEVEILSARNWWKRDPDEVVRTIKARFATAI